MEHSVKLPSGLLWALSGPGLPIAAFAGACLAILIWINAAWWSWHGGAMQFGNRLFLAVTPMLIVMTAYGTRMGGHRLTPIVLALLVAWNVYAFAGVSIARLRGNWDPSLHDTLGWESHAIGAVRERWSKERGRFNEPSGAAPSSAR
jgi:hypothetical protein